MKWKQKNKPLPIHQTRITQSLLLLWRRKKRNRLHKIFIAAIKMYLNLWHSHSLWILNVIATPSNLYTATVWLHCYLFGYIKHTHCVVRALRLWGTVMMTCLPFTPYFVFNLSRCWMSNYGFVESVPTLTWVWNMEPPVSLVGVFVHSLTTILRNMFPFFCVRVNLNVCLFVDDIIGRKF